MTFPTARKRLRNWTVSPRKHVFKLQFYAPPIRKLGRRSRAARLDLTGAAYRRLLEAARNVCAEGQDAVNAALQRLWIPADDLVRNLLTERFRGLERVPDGWSRPGGDA